MPPEYALQQWGITLYGEALARQNRLVGEILAGNRGLTLVLTEHYPVYTRGRASRPEEILNPGAIPVVTTDRGGRVTYHGPGQLIAYVLRDMRASPHAVRDHVHRLEETILLTLAGLGLAGERLAGAPGIWIDGAKIAALGVRIRQGVAYHGLAINRDPDLACFAGIIPCGLAARGVTSLARLGVILSRQELESHYLRAFARVFGAA